MLPLVAVNNSVLDSRVLAWYVVVSYNDVKMSRGGAVVKVGLRVLLEVGIEKVSFSHVQMDFSCLGGRMNFLNFKYKVKKSKGRTFL